MKTVPPKVQKISRFTNKKTGRMTYWLYVWSTVLNMYRPFRIPRELFYELRRSYQGYLTVEM